MGRSFYFYAIKVDLQHEREQYELETELYMHFNPINLHDEKDTGLSFWRSYKKQLDAQKEFYKKNEPYIQDNTTNYKKIENKDWCRRCAMFAGGINGSTLVVESIYFEHSNSNPIWDSNWHLYNMQIGNGLTDFCNRFGPRYMYREISQTDVDHMKKQVNNFGTIYREIDKAAEHEIEMVIAFCEKWVDSPDVVVIYQFEL